MRVFTCTDHAGHWPVGVASVVVAENISIAYETLMGELANQGLARSHFTLVELPLDKSSCRILCNGDY